jgi:hypothetical protein
MSVRPLFVDFCLELVPWPTNLSKKIVWTPDPELASCSNTQNLISAMIQQRIMVFRA